MPHTGGARDHEPEDGRSFEGFFVLVECVVLSSQYDRPEPLQVPARAKA